MSHPRRRLHRWLAIGYLLVAFFAPVAHLHGRGYSRTEPARGTVLDHAPTGTPTLADRPCDCPACHFSANHLASFGAEFRFDPTAAGSIGISPVIDAPTRRPLRATGRGPPSV